MCVRIGEGGGQKKVSLCQKHLDGKKENFEAR